MLGFNSTQIPAPTMPKPKTGVQIPRLVPTQKRSRERYELILSTAAEIISENGGDALKMSEIVERTGIPFGSLYQYFPDKIAVIGTLAERFNLEGRACVEAELAGVKTQEDLHAALLRVADGYYQMFMENPLMRDIWQATQADRILQQLDQEDVEALASILSNAIHTVQPGKDKDQTFHAATLIMHLIAAAVRHAINLEEKDGKQVMAMFKSLLPQNLDKITANH